MYQSFTPPHFRQRLRRAGRRLLTAALLLAGAVGSAHAYSFQQAGICYTILSDSDATVRVDYYSSSSSSNASFYTGNITVPESVYYNGTTYAVTQIGEKAFYYCSDLYSVSIPVGVTSIGASAFYNCTNLESVTVPNTVLTIGASAFYGCSALPMISIPGSVTNIYNTAFYGCTALEMVRFEDSTETLTLGYNSSAGLFKHLECSFYIGRPLSYSTGSSNGYTPFYGGKALSVTFGGGCTEINSSLFYGCASLTTVTLGRSVAKVNSGAFANTGITTLNLQADSCVTVNTTVSNTYPSTIVNLNVADNVKHIPAVIAANCTDLATLTLPASVETIGESAFSGCTGLGPELTIPAGVTSIANGAFSGCTGITNLAFNATDCLTTTNPMPSTLTSATIGAGVTRIPDNLFNGCAGITSLTLPSSLTAIGNNAFEGCTGLTEMVIPAGVLSVGNHAFSGCTSLASIEVAAGEQPLMVGYGSSKGNSYGIFADCPAEITVNRPVRYWTTTVDEETETQNWLFHASPFQGGAMTKVSLNAAELVSTNMFSGCTELAEVTLPAELNEIPDDYEGTAEVWDVISWETVTGTWNSSAQTGAVDGMQYTCVSPGHSGSTKIRCRFRGAVTFAVYSSGESGCDYLTIGYMDSSCSRTSYQYSLSGSPNTWKEYTFTPSDNAEHYVEFVYSKDSSVNSYNDNATVYVKNVSGVTYANIGTANSVAPGMFQNCAKLTAVNLPSWAGSVRASAFDGCTALESVTLCDTLRVVGNSAFRGCSSLASLTLPGTVNSVEARAFEGCSALEAIVLPATVTEIPEYAFKGCSSLRAFTVNPTVTAIGNYAFDGCTALESLRIEDGTETLTMGYGSTGSGSTSLFHNLKGSLYVGRPLDYSTSVSLGFSPFAQSATIQTITFGPGLTELPDYMFQGSTGLMAVNLPNTVTKIGAQAFQGCSNLRSFTVGANVRTIGSNAFYNCSKLSKVILLPNTPPEGLYLYSVTGRQTYASNESYSNLSNAGTINRMDYLSSIFEVDGVKYVPLSPSEGTCVAIDCVYGPNITDINIGETVSYMGRSLNVTQVNGNTLRDNPYITHLSLTHRGNVGAYAFSGCSALTDAVLNYRGDVGVAAFQGCSALENVTIGNTGNIGSNAFAGCTSLRSVSLDNTGAIGTYAFSGCSALESVTLPGSLTDIAEGAFKDCSSLRQLALPSSVVAIGQYSFANSGLEAITVPSATRLIDNYAFQGCTALAELNVRDSRDPISLGYNRFNSSGTGAGLFADCPLTRVRIGRNLSYTSSAQAGYSPFYRSATLAEVTVSDRVSEIHNNEFYGCTALRSVSLGDFVSKIGHYAFSGCSALESFTFGAALAEIGMEAFSDCTGITNLYAEAATPPTCGTQALDDINKWECTLHVSDESLELYKVADQWKEFFFAEAYEFPGYPGDANGDGTITEADLTTIVSEILGHTLEEFALMGADIDGDGEVTVADIVLGVQLLLAAEHDPEDEAGEPAAAPRVLAAAPAAWTADRDMLDGSLQGETAVALRLDGRDDYVGAQLDVTLPAGMTLVGTATESDHMTRTARLEGRGNTYRVVAMSMTNACFTGADATVTLTIACDGTAAGELAVSRSYANFIEGDHARESRVEAVSIPVTNTSALAVATADGLTVEVLNRTIVLTAPRAMAVTLADTAGRWQRLELHEGVNTVEVAVPGIYMVDNRKLIVK